MESIEIIYYPRVLVSKLRGRFDYVMLCFLWVVDFLGGDCMITLYAVVAMLLHP